jgi:SAM-dependent methyltransferase
MAVAWLVIAALAVIVVALRASAAWSHSDLPRVAAGEIVAVAIGAALVLRSWQGVLGSVLVVGVATAVALAFASLVGARTPALPLVIALGALGVQLAAYVGGAYAARIHRERTRTPPRPLPSDRLYLLSESLRDVRGSLVWCTATTLVVFATIYFVEDAFAGVLLVGFLAAAISAATLLPAIYALAPVEIPERRRGWSIAELGARLPPTVVLAVGALALAAGVVGLWRLDAALLRMFVIAFVALWAVFCLGFGSLRRGTVALVATLPGVVLLVAFGDVNAFAGVLALALATHHTIRFFKCGSMHERTNPNEGRERVIALTLEEVGGTLAWSSLAVGLACAALALADGATEATVALLAAVGVSFAWQLVSLPAMLALSRRPRGDRKVRAKDWTFIENFHKVTGAEQSGITSFADYTDDQIRNMFVGDFFALCGKTVMRHGGTHGTRRLLTELDIKPHTRVLEIGTGVGTTSFDLVSADPTIHVTSVDLSVFMIEATRARADEYSRQWRALHPNEDPSHDPGKRQEFIHTDDPNVMPFPDNSFDVVIVEAVASYNDPPQFFREIFRVLKPGGRMGLHDWCWTEEPTKDLEVHVCVLACGCNPGEMRFYTHADWSRNLTSQGFEIPFAEEYPFTFFSWGTMADDEGTWPLIKMFGRVLARRAILDRMMRMMMILARHEGAFGYTITVGRKPLVAQDVAAMHHPHGEPERNPAPPP